MQVKFKRLHPDAVLPTYAHDGDAGMDLVAVGYKVLIPGIMTEYSLGLSMEVPKGYVALIFPRGSISNTGDMLANCVGVIDAGYRGEITARFRNVDNGGRHYEKGEKVCQMIIFPFPTIHAEWAEELSETERGTGGYGSTGR